MTTVHSPAVFIAFSKSDSDHCFDQKCSKKQQEQKVRFVPLQSHQPVNHHNGMHTEQEASEQRCYVSENSLHG